MKYLFYLCLAFCFSSCNYAQNAGDVSFKATTQYSISVGYGNIYRCVIINNPYKRHVQDTVSLVFLAGDPMENKLKENKPQLFVFKKEEENVPYHTMPLTGFVDKNMTSWKLISISDM